MAVSLECRSFSSPMPFRRRQQACREQRSSSETQCVREVHGGLPYFRKENVGLFQAHPAALGGGTQESVECGRWVLYTSINSSSALMGRSSSSRRRDSLRGGPRLAASASMRATASVVSRRISTSGMAITSNCASAIPGNLLWLAMSA